jgi:hypothetical protein
MKKKKAPWQQKEKREVTKANGKDFISSFKGGVRRIILYL